MGNEDPRETRALVAPREKREQRARSDLRVSPAWMALTEQMGSTALGAIGAQWELVVTGLFRRTGRRLRSSMHAVSAVGMRASVRRGGAIGQRMQSAIRII